MLRAGLRERTGDNFFCPKWCGDFRVAYSSDVLVSGKRAFIKECLGMLMN